MCNTCKELNEEKERFKVSEIYIERAGYYSYNMPVIHCPVCGNMLDKYAKMTKEELEYTLNYECIASPMWIKTVIYIKRKEK